MPAGPLLLLTYVPNPVLPFHSPSHPSRKCCLFFFPLPFHGISCRYNPAWQCAYAPEGNYLRRIPSAHPHFFHNLCSTSYIGSTFLVLNIVLASGTWHRNEVGGVMSRGMYVPDGTDWYLLQARRKILLWVMSACEELTPTTQKVWFSSYPEECIARKEFWITHPQWS